MQIAESGSPRSRNGSWLVLAAAVLWGTTGTAQAFAPPGAQPAAVGGVRLAIGGLALLALAISRGSLRSRKHWPVLPTGLAAACMAAYQLCFFAALSRTGVAVGTIVTIGSAPILAGFIGFLALGERLDTRWAAATALAVLGTALLLLSGGGVTMNGLGVLLALGAGVAYATFTVASKGLLEVQASETVMAVVFCLGALLLSPLLFTADLGWLAHPDGLVVALHLGLVTTAVAYTLFARGLVAVPVATAVTLSLAEPLTAGTLGVVVLGERLSILGFLGVLLVLSGLALLSLSRREP